MGGQETLLLIARYPRLLAGAAALDSVTDLGRRYAKLLTAPCGASCRQRYGSRYGRLLQRALRREVGGTPAIAPAAYAARSPQSLAGRIASSSVPLQLWWSDADEIVSDPHAQSARLFRTLNRLNRCAPLVAYVGRWAHSKEMHADALLPVALAHFGLVPAEEAAALLASWPSVARLPASGASGCAKTTYSASKESPALNRRLGMRKRGRSKRAWLRQIEQIYATRYRDFLRVAHAEIGDAAVARLVVHEAFVGVVRDGDRSLRSSPPETRLWGAVLRAAAAARPHPPLLVLPNNPSAVRLARVRTATAALPALERHALYLRRFGKLTNATMAVVLGLEPDDVDRVVAAAHRSLAEAFENDREEVCHERQAV